MPATGEQVLAIADRYDVALNSAEDKVIRKVQDALETAYLQMERQLIRAYDNNARNLSLLPQQRALLIQQEIAEQLNRLDGDTQSLYAADFERMIRQSYGSGRDMAAELALAIADERLQSFAAVPLSAVRFAAENATSRLKNHTKRLRDQIATNISAGIALGSSSRKVAEQLRGELGLTKTRAEMIARTETLAAHNEAAKDAYQRNGIELVIWLGTSDERMCRFCAARNGNVYRASEVVVPLHPRDRCTLTPYKPEWERAGLVDVDFYKRHRAKGLKELEESGRSPNYGPGPFEKKKKAPKTALNLGDAKPFPKKKAKPSEPTITVEELTQSIQEQTSKVNAAQSKAFKALQSGEPSEELQQIFADESNKLLSLQNQLKELEVSQAKQKQKAKSKELKRVEALFPDSIGGLKEVRPLGGSTGAMLVEDPATGRKFVLKRGNSPDHLREEFNADKAYKALGVPVPEVKLYETGNGPVKLAEFIEGESLDSVLSKGGKAAEKAKAKIQKHFAVDALMANWDVVGLNADNILIDKKGIPYRIDNGGSLRFRAQGATKNKDWNRYPDELWTLREPNNSASNAFDTMRFAQAMEQVENIDIKALKKALPKELHDTIQGRYEEMSRLADISRTMFEDKWKEDYIDGFTRHMIGIRQAGISESLPKKLGRAVDGVVVIDENGKEFDDLRGGDNGIIGRLSNYISEQGGDYRAVSSWMSGQAGSSWSGQSKTLKYYMTGQRDVSRDEYFWKDPLKGIEKDANKFINDSYEVSFQSYHAFQYEMMDNIDFDGRNGKNKTVSLIRTEDDFVIALNNLTPGDKGKVIQRGAIESTSIYERVEVYGTELTVQEVPYHRVFGNYFTQRYVGLDDGAFLGDDENEFVVMLEGLKFDYHDDDEGLWQPPKPSLADPQKTKSKGKKKGKGSTKIKSLGLKKEKKTDAELSADLDALLKKYPLL